MNRNALGQFMPKTEISIKEGTLLAFNAQPKTFHGVTFIIDVRIIIGRPMCPDGSIFRELRYLRDDDKVINYRCKDREISLYEKRDIIKEA